MKIIKVAYENFRNFRDPGMIECSTDGKVTIIYGVNGAGKTTFHQLFYWVIYGKYNFNKTSTDKLYNLDFESKCEINKQFKVYGSIDFEQEGKLFSMSREWTYKKTLYETSVLKKTFSILKKTENNDWERLNNPEEFVENILPSGLAEYFFFDGESMIADLKVKGKDSAKSLKDALYNILDLSVYDKAVKVIGNEDQKTTVLGALFLNKVSSSTNEESKKVEMQMEQAQSRRDKLTENLEKYQKEIESNQELINSISEKIGEVKSQKEYESMRETHKKSRDSFIKQSESEYARFGEEFAHSFPRFFLSAAVENAKDQILKQGGNTVKLIDGISVALLDSLKKEKECICGHTLGENEIHHINEFYKYLPPYGYDSLYYNFKVSAMNWGKEYNREKIEQIIYSSANLLHYAHDEDLEIQKIDELLKENKKYEELVNKRIAAEDKIKQLTVDSLECSGELAKAKALVKKFHDRIIALSQNELTNKVIENKMLIMQEVKKHFIEKLEDKSRIYSSALQNNIQDLVNRMLEAKRTVSVSTDFALKVFDEHGDETKSEGQFATISFAYIGGIFKLLKENNMITNKEYPLVLDAPFSKLGDLPRQKVIETIPEYAPQIILFSKDNLQECFPEDAIGKVYTIISNETQNIAKLEEGFLWK